MYRIPGTNILDLYRGIQSSLCLNKKLTEKQIIFVQMFFMLNWNNQHVHIKFN